MKSDKYRLGMPQAGKFLVMPLLVTTISLLFSSSIVVGRYSSSALKSVMYGRITAVVDSISTNRRSNQFQAVEISGTIDETIQSAYNNRTTSSEVAHEDRMEGGMKPNGEFWFTLTGHGSWANFPIWSIS